MQSLFLQVFLVENEIIFSPTLPTNESSFFNIEFNNFSKNVFVSGELSLLFL